MFLGSVRVPVYVGLNGSIDGAAIANVLAKTPSSEIKAIGFVFAKNSLSNKTSSPYNDIIESNDLETIQKTVQTCTNTNVTSKQYCQWIPDINELNYIDEGNKYLGKR